MMKSLFFDVKAQNFLFRAKTLPPCSAHHSLLKVAGSCINRADILKTRGRYPGSPQSGDDLGIECVGYRVDPRQPSTLIDNKLYGTIVNGGGFAQYACVPTAHLFEMPPALSLPEAAATPEAFLTAFQLVDRFGPPRLHPFDAYVPAAAGGIGSSVVQLLKKTRDCNVIASANGAQKCAFVQSLGADCVLDRSCLDVDMIINKSSDKGGVDVVFDCIGSDQWQLHSQILKPDGRWILYGLLGNRIQSASTSMLLEFLLAKRLNLAGTMLKARSNEYKAQLVKDFVEYVVPFLASGKIKPVVGQVINIDFENDRDAAKMDAAFNTMKANANFGRIVVLFS